ncbi:MAG: hypothetical protein L0211_13435, partial [Planctomycetaceae bacterium]|nr:hypothetical protein [Planctomycetaceae bacterium]
QLAPPDELRKAIEDRFAPERARLGNDADWQFALFAARQYESSSRFREAIETLQRGRIAIETIADAAKRSHLHREFDSELSSIVARAASQGEIVLALESASRFHLSSARGEILDHIAYCTSKVGLAAAETSTSQLSARTSPCEWRLLLLLTCRGGSAAQYERAIQKFLDDGEAMDAADVRRCYVALANTVRTLPRDFNPQVLARLEAQLATDIASGAQENKQGVASKCLATLLIAQGRLEEARRVTDENGQLLLQTHFGRAAAEILVAQGKYNEAVEMSRGTLTHVAAALTNAGQLDAALDAIAKFEDRGAGYAGYATSVARKFAERDNWSGVERALALIDDARSWDHCVTQVAAIGARAGRHKQVVALLRRLGDRLVDSGHARQNVEQRLALAYLKAGETTTAWQLVERQGDNLGRAMLLVEIAESNLDRRDLAGFQKAMEPLKAIVAGKLNGGPAEMTAEERGQLQVDLALRSAVLYIKAGEKRQAQQVIQGAFAGAGDLAGSFWRMELYSEMFLTSPTQDTITSIAHLVDAVPLACDRAILACLAGTLAAKYASAPMR